MICQVTKGIRIRSEDGMNYTLEERKVVQSGKTKGQEIWNLIGYYGSLKHACNALLNNHIALLVNSRTGLVSTKLELRLNQVVEAVELASLAITNAIEAMESADG